MKTIRYSTLMLLFFSSWALAQGLPGKDLEPVSQESIRPLINICESCHGAGGQTTRLDIPPIAGKPASFILESLEQFYYYERHCPEVEIEDNDGNTVKKNMCDVTNALTQPEGLALGQYFENQEPASGDE